jgi:hypothetical protein
MIFFVNKAGTYSEAAIGSDAITGGFASNTWHRMVVKQIISSGTSGRVYCWIDGLLVATDTGINGGGFPLYMKDALYDGGAVNANQTAGSWYFNRCSYVVKDNAQVYTEPDIRALLT